MDDPAWAHTLTLERTWREPGGVTVLALRAEPPLGHAAGQWVEVGLPGPGGAAARRVFSIASPPGEDLVMLATLVEHAGPPSPFKDALAALRPGDELRATEPKGAFGLAEDDRDAPHVFVAIGIGVSAVRALALHAAELGLRGRVLQTPVGDAHPFADDLRHLAGHGIGYMKLNDVPPSPRALDALVDGDVRAARWYLAGPEPTVRGLRRALLLEGLPPDRVRAEPFPGYRGPAIAADAA